MRLSEIQKKTIVVNEKRKNPDQNPKIPIGIAVRDHLSNAKIIPETRVKNSFISFTKNEKLGINTRSKYDTPLGIYAYPSEYVVSVVGEKDPMSDLPFAGDSPYGNIFSVRGNIVDLNNMTESDYQKYVTAVFDFTVENKQIRKGSDEWKEHVDCFDDLTQNAIAFPQFSSPGGKLWLLTMHVAYKPKISGMKTKNGSVAWNKLFRSIGIDGCIDMGRGIIHTHEKTQAVFFSMKSILGVVRHDNKTYVSSPEVLYKAYEILISKKSLNPSVIQNLEDAIATSAVYSYGYARDVLEARFPEGESAIATSAVYSYDYARDVLKARFPEGESAIRGSKWQEDYEQLFGIKL